MKFINHNGYGNQLYLDNTNLENGVFVDYYPDMDGDSYGDITTSVVPTLQANPPPANHVLDNTDCDDNNINVNPASTSEEDRRD